MHACSCAYQLKGLVGHHERVKDWQRPLSCRYEVMSTDLGVLEELDIVLVGIDRPSYGWSDSDADRCPRPACCPAFLLKLPHTCLH